MQWSPSRRRKMAATVVMVTVGWVGWVGWICNERYARRYIASDPAPPIRGMGAVKNRGEPRFPSVTSLPSAIYRSLRLTGRVAALPRFHALRIKHQENPASRGFCLYNPPPL